MKKIALLLLSVFALNSCDISGDEPNYHLEVLPIESYTVPQSFDMNGVYEIKVTYKRPTDCHYYESLYYEKNLDTRVFAIQSRVLSGDKCVTLTDDAPIEVKFNFECTPGNTHYVFKFYKGQDEDGNDIFEDVTIPVTY